MWIYKLFLPLIIISCALSVYAQDSTMSSPELTQMRVFAERYVQMGNYKLAITTYNQLIALNPGKTILYTELANAYFSSGDYDNAAKTLQDVVSKPNANDISYQLLAASQSAQKHYKKAKSTVENGLTRFPTSGLLYNQQGLVYKEDNDIPGAVNAWTNGINSAPSFALNYKDAALAYLTTDNVLWGLLYGETYLSMRHRTADDSELLRAIYAGWSTYFSNLTNEDIHTSESAFEKSINDIYKEITPVVSDGISAENLAMAHIRFLMKWFSLNRQPFPLFTYQDSLIRNGWFDVYNEQLYGNAESPVQHEAWAKFHNNDMHRFTSWQDTHRLVPASQPNLNNKSEASLRKIFAKKKKR